MPGLLTRSAAAKALGITPTALSRLVERGCPVARRASSKGKPALYDVAAIRAWRAERLTHVPAPAPGRERKDAALAELAEIRVAKARGELILASEAIAVARDLAETVKAAVLAVPRRAVLAGLPQEHEARVKALLIEALRGLV